LFQKIEIDTTKFLLGGDFGTSADHTTFWPYGGDIPHGAYVCRLFGPVLLMNDTEASVLRQSVTRQNHPLPRQLHVMEYLFRAPGTCYTVRGLPSEIIPMRTTRIMRWSSPNLIASESLLPHCPFALPKNIAQLVST